jgi:hypothetical protein
MNKPRIVYQSRAGTTPGIELDALAGIFRYVLFESKAGKRITEQVPQATTIEVPKQGKETAMTG